MEITVNGKRVVLRERFPAEEYWALRNKAHVLWEPDAPFEETAGLLAQVVESWEFDGDPTQISSYRKLDLFREFTLLLSEAAKALVGTLEAKN